MPGKITVELRPGDMPTTSALSQADDQSMTRPPGKDIPAAASPLIPVIKIPEPHYFRTTQLTQKPVVLRDLTQDLVLVLPELPEDVAILRLLINDHGGIDKVIVEDSRLPETAERRIVDAFSKITFQPGKIGRIAVRTQVKIEIRTADFSLPREKLSQHGGVLAQSGNQQDGGTAR